MPKNNSLIKYSLFLSCLFLSLDTLAQEGEHNPPGSISANPTTFNAYGYIDGKRLDSLTATYASFGYYSGSNITFDYGQQSRKRRENLITDSKGEPLSFTNTSLPFILNFFHYNHWDYFNTNYSSSTKGDNSATIILKKE